MSDWKPKHETIWLALGNDEYNTLIGTAGSYELIALIGKDWSNRTGATHYLREYIEKPEPTEPVLPNIIEINGSLYHKG